MNRIVYLNGSYCPEKEAKVSIFDRGFLFSDGVYEVTSVLEKRLIDFEGHIKRLERSLKELEMAMPNCDFLEIHRELVQRNHVQEGVVYLQITRGVADDRSFLFPPSDSCPPTVFSLHARNEAD